MEKGDDAITWISAVYWFIFKKIPNYSIIQK
jgi:hypothetical protein